jgi:hypothetical protein
MKTETLSTLGNGLTRNTTYNPTNLTLQNISLNNGGTKMDDVDYSFLPSSGNLQQRNDKTNARNELFGHDAINRLNSMKINSAPAHIVRPACAGNDG